MAKVHGGCTYGQTAETGGRGETEGDGRLRRRWHTEGEPTEGEKLKPRKPKIEALRNRQANATPVRNFDWRPNRNERQFRKCIIRCFSRRRRHIRVEIEDVPKRTSPAQATSETLRLQNSLTRR